MAEVVVFERDGLELVFDTDDIERFETPRDVIVTGRQWSWKSRRFVTYRKLGPHAHLNITFKPGRQPHWRPVTGGEPAEPYAKPLPRPVPEPLATAIRDATWTAL